MNPNTPAPSAITAQARLASQERLQRRLLTVEDRIAYMDQLKAVFVLEKIELLAKLKQFDPSSPRVSASSASLR